MDRRGVVIESMSIPSAGGELRPALGVDGAEQGREPGRRIDAVLDDEKPGDADAIRGVTEEAFRGQPYSCGREFEIVDQLRATGALSLSLVARIGSRIVGHIAVSRVEAASNESGWFGIGPLSVLPEFQRQGIGSLLMDAALNRMRAIDAKGCVLVGHPEYYRRFGFSTGQATVAGVPAEVTLCRKLQAGSDPGTVKFHEALTVH